jgi:threonine/homoserine/homoserine lactone efflux protein
MLEPAFFSYTALMSITPGPNNLLLASTGVNFGFRRTLPFMAGIVVGMATMLSVLVPTLGTFVQAFSAVRPLLTLVGVAYLLWLSWKIAGSTSLKDDPDRRPPGVLGGALFQLLNPKAWMMTVNTALLFVPRDVPPLASLPTLVAWAGVVNLACISVWALAGDRLRQVLSRGRALRIFNGTMGALMAGTAVWLLAEEFLGARIGV